MQTYAKTITALAQLVKSLHDNSMGAITLVALGAFALIGYLEK